MSAVTRKNRAVILIGSAVAFCAALVGFALGQGQDREPDAPTGIAVPRVVDRPAADAIQVLEAAGLHVLVTYSVSDSAEPDTVIEQDPPAGVTVRDGTVAQITVASGQARSLSVPGDGDAGITNVELPAASYRAETGAAPMFGAIAGTVAEVVQANRAVGDPRPRSRSSNPAWTAI